MVGLILVELRERIKALASEDGEYAIVCGRTGERPVPAAGRRFDSRTRARRAARATEQYRATLRRYDPRLPYYDLIVCEATGPAVPSDCAEGPSQETAYQTLSKPVLDSASPDSEHRDLVEYCHRVAAAVFETLSEHGYDDVETAVMDAYFDLAETVADPDDLCLCLVESMALELDTQLEVTEQADVLADAATRLGDVEPSPQPLASTLTVLTERGLIGSYSRSPWSLSLADGTRSVVVRLSEYALSPRQGRLPVLPVVLDLYRRQSAFLPSALRVVEREDCWRVTFVLATEMEPSQLASVHIHSEV